MSTTPNPLKYLWSAHFADGTIIRQPADDRYSKHDDSADYNPSAFRDLEEYQEKSELVALLLEPQDSESPSYAVSLPEGFFFAGPIPFSLETEPLTERKLIYYREMHWQQIGGETQIPFVNRYVFGYEGKDNDGKIVKKLIHIAG